MKPKKPTDKHVKLVEKKHTEVVKEKYGKDKDRFMVVDPAALKKEGKDRPDQPNLFGDQDFVFSAIQEEMSGIHTMIERTVESIDKKKEILDDLKRRKQQLDKAAVIIKNSKHLLKEGDKVEGF